MSGPFFGQAGSPATFARVNCASAAGRGAADRFTGRFGAAAAAAAGAAGQSRTDRTRTTNDDQSLRILIIASLRARPPAGRTESTATRRNHRLPHECWGPETCSARGVFKAFLGGPRIAAIAPPRKASGALRFTS